MIIRKQKSVDCSGIFYVIYKGSLYLASIIQTAKTPIATLEIGTLTETYVQYYIKIRNISHVDMSTLSKST